MRSRLSRALHDRRVLAFAALVCLVAAAAPTGLLSHLPGVYSLPDRWTEARPGWLYRSGQIPASDVQQVLAAEHIDVVLDLTDDSPDGKRSAERVASEKLGIRYLHLPVEHQKEKVISNLARAVAEIELARRRGDRVLVHCTYGHRRSAAALALYARLIEHEPPHIAFAEFSRYAEADSQWSAGMISYLDKNMSEIDAQVKRDLANPPLD
jgi:protein-tyrosine phosphatase